jgi:mono/diheme cytochrome c family protein
VQDIARNMALAAAASLMLCAPARADEFALKLRDAPGAETVADNCAACHSLDYILMNAPFPKRAVWQAEVGKMIKAYGAQIGEDDAKAIVDYLAANYGS